MVFVSEGSRAEGFRKPVATENSTLREFLEITRITLSLLVPKPPQSGRAEHSWISCLHPFVLYGDVGIILLKGIPL